MIEDKKIKLVEIDNEDIKKEIDAFFKFYNSELSYKYFRHGINDDGTPLYKAFDNFYYYYEEHISYQIYSFCNEIQKAIEEENNIKWNNDIEFYEQRLNIYSYYFDKIAMQIEEENNYNLDDYKTLKWLLSQFYRLC